MYESVSMIFSQRAIHSQARVLLCYSLSLSLSLAFRSILPWFIPEMFKNTKNIHQALLPSSNFSVYFFRFFSAYECGIAYVSDLFSTYGTSALISNHLEIPIFVINRLLAYYHTWVVFFVLLQWYWNTSFSFVVTTSNYYQLHLHTQLISSHLNVYFLEYKQWIELYLLVFIWRLLFEHMIFRKWFKTASSYTCLPYTLAICFFHIFWCSHQNAEIHKSGFYFANSLDTFLNCYDVITVL